MTSRTEARQRARNSASSLTIMHRQIEGISLSPPPPHMSIPGKVHTQDTLEDAIEQSRDGLTIDPAPYHNVALKGRIDPSGRPHRSVRRLRASACCEYRAFLCEVGERRPRTPPGGDVLRRLNNAVARRRRRIGPCITAFAPERASERWPCSHSPWTTTSTLWS